MTDETGSEIDISIILTGHREKVLAGPTALSAREAITYATTQLGLSCEVILVLDRADATTRDILLGGLGDGVRVLETDEGDPGQARNRGISAANGQFSAFLDGDDLWSYNWLSEAWRVSRDRPDAVLHSACNIVFGDEENLWWHVDSEDPAFDPDYLIWANYWDALSFASTEIHRKYPFVRNDLDLGFGHEDWHWHCLTHAAGIVHKPVPGTVHFKRRRKGSQMSLVEKFGAVVLPLELN
jgi:glycosyltransferase involved in cell wall biosynthesis